MLGKVLDKLEAKFGRNTGIPNLMTLIVAGMAAAVVGEILLMFLPSPNISLIEWLTFDKAAILRGQVWRVFTFVFVPPDASIIFMVFALYFYWMLGNTLEREWGTLRFTLFYMCGMLGNVIAGTITNYATSHYLNLSLFLAAALIYPNNTLNIYGILPVKMKWLALMDLALILYSFIFSSWPVRIAVIVSLVNVLLFFIDKLLNQIAAARRRYEWKKNWRNGNWR